MEQRTPEWYAWRKQGLGGSDAPKIVGISPHGGPFDVYTEKTDEGPLPEPNAEQLRGQLLEQAIRAWYMHTTGRVVVESPLLVHPLYPWMRASLDGLVLGGEEPHTMTSHAGTPVSVLADRGFESKSATRRLGGKIPEDWYCQVQHYLAVTGLPAFDLVALTGALEFVQYEVERDEGYIEDLITVERDWWYKHYVPRVPPAIDGSKGASAYLSKRYPKDDGETVEADADTAAAVRALMAVRARLAQYNKSEATLKNAIKDKMGTASYLTGPDFRISYKRSRDSDHVDYALLVKTYEGIIATVRPVLESVEWDGRDETLALADTARGLYTVKRPGSRRFLIRGTEGEQIEEEEESTSDV